MSAVEPCSSGRESAPSFSRGEVREEGNPAAHRTLLLGLGNDLLCDDAIGLRVTAALRERLKDDEGVTVAETPEMGLALLDLMVDFDDLILVDAVQTHQAVPGFVHELETTDLKVLPTISSHFLGIGEVIALGRELGLAVPRRVRIFAVEVEDLFTVTTQMTPALEARLPEIVERIWRLVVKQSDPEQTPPVPPAR